MDRNNTLKAAAVIELAIAAAAILLDVFIPTLVILGLIIISLLLRSEKISSLGFKKSERPLRMILTVFILAVMWTLVDIGIVLPVLNHLTGTTQDLSTYQNLKGNVGQLIFLLAASWTLAAIGEEVVYRGFIQNRIGGLFKNRRVGIILAICISSVLFGFAHTEQGIIGVTVTAIDAVFFSLVKRKFNNNLWASILAHGFNNTIGIVTFFFTGPIYGLW